MKIRKYSGTFFLKSSTNIVSALIVMLSVIVLPMSAFAEDRKIKTTKEATCTQQGEEEWGHYQSGGGVGRLRDEGEVTGFNNNPTTGGCYKVWYRCTYYTGNTEHTHDFVGYQSSWNTGVNPNNPMLVGFKVDFDMGGHCPDAHDHSERLVGDTYKKATPALGHTWSGWKTDDKKYTKEDTGHYQQCNRSTNGCGGKYYHGSTTSTSKKAVLKPHNYDFSKVVTYQGGSYFQCKDCKHCIPSGALFELYDNFKGDTKTKTTFNIDIETSFTVPAISGLYVHEGYNFKGWSASKNGAVEYSDGYTFSQSYTSSHEGVVTKLYAQWEAVTYTLEFDTNLGTIAGAETTTFTKAFESTAKDEPLVTTNSKGNYNITCVREGYNFKGWAVMEGCDNGSYENIGTNTDPLKNTTMKLIAGNKVWQDYTSTQGNTVTLVAIWEHIHTLTLSRSEVRVLSDKGEKLVTTYKSKELSPDNSPYIYGTCSYDKTTADDGTETTTYHSFTYYFNTNKMKGFNLLIDAKAVTSQYISFDKCTMSSDEGYSLQTKETAMSKEVSTAKDNLFNMIYEGIVRVGVTGNDTCTLTGLHYDVSCHWFDKYNNECGESWTLESGKNKNKHY